jgi:hypothetical protein
MQHSGVTARKGLWEIHYDPYDVPRVWVRDHWNGGWITVFWTQLHRVAAPFGELAWDHARKSMPGAAETELADAVKDLLTRAGQGPGDGNGPGRVLSKRDRRVAASTRAVQPAGQPDPGPAPQEIPQAGKPGRPRSSRCRSSTRSGRRRNGGDPARRRRRRPCGPDHRRDRIGLRCLPGRRVTMIIVDELHNLDMATRAGDG